jgi:hypothetical protein
MKYILFAAVLSAVSAAVTTVGNAATQVPAGRIVAVTPDWASNRLRQSDTYLIATVDHAGRVVSLCGNMSGQCAARLYRK